jgi:ribosomal protein S18 acetylase RimI-like enzyme
MKIVPITAELLDEVVRVHRDAFASYPNVRLGRPYARRFLGWFASREDGIALAAVDDAGAVLGYVTGARGAYGYPLSHAMWPVAGLSMLLRPWVLLDRRILRAAAARVQLWRRPPSTPAELPPVLVPPLVSLVALGTSRHHRRAGVAAALVDRFEDAARALGARTVRLTVYQNNAAARTLYERRGWSPLFGSSSETMTYWKAL